MDAATLHRAALASIQLRTEVGAVLEDILDDLEAWEWQTRVRELEARLTHSEATVAALRESERGLLESVAGWKAKEARRAAGAVELKERLAREMWGIAKELKRLHLQEARAQCLTRELTSLKGELDGVKTELVIARAKIASRGAQAHSNDDAKSALALQPPASLQQVAPASPSRKCSLLLLQDTTLLKIFTFLEAPGVLNTAATCRESFQRVDSLFGFGNSVSILQKDSATGVASLPQLSSSSGSSGSLGKKVSPAADNTPGLTAEMVNAMALKLSNAEMKGIISITGRNKALAGQAAELKAERDGALAKLRSAEEAKDSLIAKVKELEDALNDAVERRLAVERQSSSDQEVVSFLDARARELELAAKEAVGKCVKKEAELEGARGEAEKKLRLLEDMLRFEKEKMEQYEIQSKQERKLLVAEVKKLRTQNLTLQRSLSNQE